MRREIKYSLVGFGIGALSGGVINLLKQYFVLEEEDKPFWENMDWERVLISAGKVGAIGAVSGHLIYRLQVSQESRLPFNADDYLHNVLSDNNIRGDRTLYAIAVKKRDQIKDFLSYKFKGMLSGTPVNWGSTARGTAVGDNFDFDIIVPFSVSSFNSLEEMYNTMYEALYRKFDGVNAKVRKQKRSLGVTFYFNSLELHFDVVPGREINNYRADKELNLFVRPENFWSRPSRIKTNLNAHRDMTVNRPDERKVVKLLKLYRDRNGLNAKSTVIQHIVIQSFDYQTPSYSLSDNLIYAMEYIAENLATSRLVDPANTGNVISESMSDFERSRFVSRLNRDIDRITNNERYFKEIFG
jgi:hypothetical protein